MQDLFKMYRNGEISWDKAFFLANNFAAALSGTTNSSAEEVNYWADQMDSLAGDAASMMMEMLGYKTLDDGSFVEPNR